MREVIPIIMPIIGRLLMNRATGMVTAGRH